MPEEPDLKKWLDEATVLIAGSVVDWSLEEDSSRTEWHVSKLRAFLKRYNETFKKE